MSDQNPDSDPVSNATQKPTTEGKDAEANADVSAEKTDSVKELTPEEQMAAFEEEMKNEDWGHQPC